MKWKKISFWLKVKYKVKNSEMTEKEHREIAEMMNHSYEESLDYAYDII